MIGEHANICSYYHFYGPSPCWVTGHANRDPPATHIDSLTPGVPIMGGGVVLFHWNCNAIAQKYKMRTQREKSVKQCQQLISKHCEPGK